MGKKLFILSFFLIILAGCEAIFTYSPFAFLAPPPGDLPPAQLNSYAESVLSSNDPALISEALEAVAATLADMDPDDPVYGDLNYTAAELSLAEAGLTLENAINGAIPDLSAASAALMDAGTYLQNAETAGEELSSLDSLMVGVAILIADPAIGNGDAAAIAGLTEAAAIGHAEAGAYFTVASGDPALVAQIYNLLGIIVP